MKMGIEFFSDCCTQLGINFEEVFCYGTGKTYYSKGKNIQRYEFRPSDKQLRQSHRYVLKYFSKDEIYLLWDLKYNQKKKREVFSADTEDVLKVLDEQKIIYFYKGIEFQHKDKEKVFVLTANDIMRFLEYAKNDVRKALFPKGVGKDLLKEQNETK